MAQWPLARTTAGLDRAGPEERGLTSSEAAARLEAAGPNDPAPRAPRHPLVQLLGLFANPLVVILLIAAVISGCLDDVANATIIIFVVLLGVGLNFAQTYRSQRAAERLSEKVAPTATVLRDGSFRELARRDVVPGDVVRLSAGDLVPADARLLSARDLHVQEAALTGESMPAEKEAASQSGPHGDRGAVFLGTSVVSGTATAVVTATGAATKFGDIATRLRARPPESEFDRGIHRFSVLIMRAVLFLVLFIVLVSVALHRPAFQSLLFAVALAVGLTPEFLPMIISVTLGAGAVKMARQKVIVKHLAAIQNLGSVDVLCSDKTGTLTEGRMVLDRSLDPLGAESSRALLLGRVNSAFDTGVRSPLDDALLSSLPAGDEGYAKLDEVPFDFERRRVSIAVERGDERLLVTKGAPEGVLAITTSYADAAGVHPLDDAAHARIRAVHDGFCGRGLRVLAVAARGLERRAAYTRDDERDLTLVGFLTFVDPTRPTAHAAVEALQRDGVTVKIVTGDNELVAQHVCGEVGLDVRAIVLGDEIDDMTDTALSHVVEKTTVFARVNPAQKNRIILALKHRSHVVAFLGDGINDAPALHAADVGISVMSAVDVARDAADIILLDSGLDVLHTGIREGRKAFGNVMKYLLMGTSSNFGNMFSMAGAAAFLPFLPMLPTQILLNNVLYALAQITIPTDNVDDELVRRPHPWTIDMIRNFMIVTGPISSVYDFLTFWVLLRFFHAGEAMFHTGWFVESLATQTLVIFVVRTLRSPFTSRASWPLTMTALGAVGVAVVLPFSPLAHVLGFTPLPGAYFAFLAVTTCTYLAMIELVKRPLLRKLLPE
jgi:Mg2+-importing ATPase